LVRAGGENAWQKHRDPLEKDPMHNHHIAKHAAHVKFAVSPRRSIAVSPLNSFGAAKRALTEIIPKTVLVYFDRVVFRARTKAVAPIQRELEKAGFEIRDRDVDAETGKRQPGQKLSISVPSKEALRLLARIDHELCSCECAIDLVYEVHDDVALYEIDDAGLVAQAMRKMICQPVPGDRHANEYKNTLYTGQRSDDHRPFHHYAMYSDKPCRIHEPGEPGEPGCVHLEHRFQGLQLLRKLNLHDAKTMLNFDHAGFWRAELPRLFVFFDAERYGRLLDNQARGTKRQHARIYETKLSNGRVFRENGDSMIGGTAYKILSMQHENDYRSMQQFVKRVGRKQPYLQAIPVDHILSRVRPVWGCTHYIGREQEMGTCWSDQEQA
jgi:hypothetical protein